jgi:hypothetical protein
MLLKNRDVVQVIKVGKAENPFHPTASKDEWEAGGWNDGKTPPMNYTNEGIIWNTPEVGKSFLMIRTKRENSEIIGFFQTSRVIDIVDTEYGCDIHTENSVYAIRLISRSEGGESEWN